MSLLENFRPKAELCFEQNNKENVVDFKTSLFFINNTDQDIWVLQRNNLPTIINHSTGQFPGLGKFVVRTVYFFGNRERIVNTINSIHAYKQKYKIHQEELNIISQTLTKAFDDNRTLSNISITIDREIALRTIQDYSSFYLPDSDIVISDNKGALKHPHPFSNEGLALGNHYNFIKERQFSGVFVELVDNEHTIKNRYMFAAKHLVEVPVKEDHSKASGVYFTKAEYNKSGEVVLEPEYYSFDDAEKELGLFKTREEALSGGNPELLISKEESAARQELSRLRLEHDREKAQQDQKQLTYKQQLMRVEAELEERRQETARLKEELEARKLKRGDKSDKKKHKIDKKKTKRSDRYEAKKLKRGDYFEDRKLDRSDYYERRSYERKDTSELLKFVPAILIGAAGTFAWMRSRNDV